MRVPGIRRLKRTVHRSLRPWRRRRRQRVPGAVILAYHRVASLPLDTCDLATTPERFADHLEVLHDRAEPVSLARCVEGLRSRDLPPRAVAVTFDDGYRDNLLGARPLLEDAKVPATVFVSTGYTGRQEEFWWDALERILMLPGQLPDTLELALPHGSHRWKVPEGSRTPFFWKVHAHLRSLDEGARQEALNQLTRWSGASAVSREHNYPMSESEVRELIRGGLVEVGGHTHRHPVLSSLSREHQRQEIVAGRERLEALTRQKVRFFAYPFGMATDFDRHSVDIVREEGFEAACTIVPGSLDSTNLDPYRLTRYVVRNWTKDEFARELERFFVD